MDCVTKKFKKGKSGYEDRPEFRNLLDSLALLKDFGYMNFWASDSEFVESFNVGGQCPKYTELMNYLEKQMELHCKSPDLAMHKATIAFLRTSSFMHRPEGLPSNPVLYRLTTTNTLVNKLLEYFLNDLSNPHSKALNNLYTINCGAQVVPNKQLGVFQAGNNSIRPSCSTSGATGGSNKVARPKRATELSAARLARLTQLAHQIHPGSDGLDLVFECELNISDEETEHL